MEDFIVFIAWVAAVIGGLVALMYVFEVLKAIYFALLFLFILPVAKYFWSFIATILICYFYFKFDFWYIVIVDALIIDVLGHSLFVYVWYPWAKQEYLNFSHPMQYSQTLRTDSQGNTIYSPSGWEKYEHKPIGREKRKIKLKEWIKWWVNMIVGYNIPAIDRKIDKFVWYIGVASFTLCYTVLYMMFRA